MFKNNFKFLIILSLPIILFSQESQAYERTVDSFAGKTTISTKIRDGLGNRIFVDKSINLAFDCVEFSKQLGKNLAMKGEKTLDKFIIKSRIDADEKDLTESLETCAIPDTKKIDNVLGFLAQAKAELQKNNYAAADYAEWEARSVYETLRKESYTLTLTITGTDEWWFFPRNALELKIDNDPICSLRILHTTDHNRLTTDQNRTSQNYILTTTAIIEIPIGIAAAIHKANRLTFRIYFSDSNKPSPPTVFEISDYNLSLWKEVIRAQ